MRTGSNEVPSQNQLAMCVVTHKFYIHAQALNFINVRQTPTLQLQFIFAGKSTIGP